MLSEHPVYQDEALVASMTRDLTASGVRTFQAWFLDYDEDLHARAVHEYVRIKPGSHILSLGCGVGGMEELWSYQDPTLTFTLVNQSQVQLDIIEEEGRMSKAELVCAKAEDYTPEKAPDYTVIAYMLGHVEDKRALLEKAIGYTKGKVIVLDVFDTTPEFNDFMAYSTIDSKIMDDLRFYHSYHGQGHWIMNPYIRFLGLKEWQIVERGSKPGMYIRRNHG